ncbi:hypothetical protein P3T76_012791 [Phytophthora citrophthora]|uniref:Uncharacterized protein n=1 Tax=Phytophthora citrophthora TaxID=4793 RepID=A0AAD9G474_9STRA|nr:hypothetical protein P3T76_012791 [Phytophthora citrophthora]
MSTTTKAIAMLSDSHVEELTSDWEVETEEHEEEDVFGNEVTATAEESETDQHAGDGVHLDHGEVLRSGIAELLAQRETPRQAETSSDTGPARMGDAYIASLRDNSSLNVSIAEQVASAYDKKGEYGIFSLFFTVTSKDRLRK